MVLAISLSSCLLEQTCDKIALDLNSTIIYDNQTNKALVVELFQTQEDSLSQNCAAFQMIQFEFEKTIEMDCGHYNPYRYDAYTQIHGTKIYNLTDTTSASFMLDEYGALDNADQDLQGIYSRRCSSGWNNNGNRTWTRLMIDDGLLRAFFQKDSTMLTRFADFYTE